mmetsp:Transcript_21097/g.68008  ORF Transcript_21097/g.68008 Transcript_21097/m.68008 type:complete len:180 (+) Transcript_21097:959-1498(+)
MVLRLVAFPPARPGTRRIWFARVGDRGVVLPEVFGSTAARARDDSGAAGPSAAWDLDDESAALATAFQRMIVGTRSKPPHAERLYLKTSLWLALLGTVVAPPRPADVPLSLTWVVVACRNKSAAQSSVPALQFAGWTNGWPSLAASPACRVPVDASIRAFFSFAGPTHREGRPPRQDLG